MDYLQKNMKHLTKYKLFENISREDIILELSDIFLDIKDLGYSVEIIDNKHGSYNIRNELVESSIFIVIRKLLYKNGICFKQEFNTDEVQSCVEWVLRYMTLNGFGKYFFSIPGPAAVSEVSPTVWQSNKKSTWSKIKNTGLINTLLSRKEIVFSKNSETDEIKLLFAK